MWIVFLVLAVIGLIAAMVFLAAAITVARIASPYPILIVVAVGISGLGSAVAALGGWNSPTGASIWWWKLLTATIVGMSVFAAVLILLVSGGILRLWHFSDQRPKSVRQTTPGLRTTAALLIIATILAMIDLQIGLQGWGLWIGIAVLVFGLMEASVAPIYRYYLKQRLADIDDFEPDLLASLNRGHVSRRVLKVIRRWTEVEKEPG